MVYSNVLEAIGHTPMIRLSKIVPEGSAEVLVKYEGVNIGGSIKTRTAYNMICDAEEKGIIHSNTIIVEPTSGNQGIGLALIGAVRGYHVRIIMPDSVSEERRKLVKAYGAELVLVHDDGDIGKCINECLQTALRMAKEDKNVWIPQQFENAANPAIHKATTAQEIWNDTDGQVDIFVSAVGTGGTVTGTGLGLKEKNPDVKVVAVEPASSPVLSGGKPGPHKIQGIGAGFVPDVLRMDILDEIIPVENDAAFETSRDVARTDGVLVGISSGAALFAATELAKRPENEGKTIVVLLPDTGERYLSTSLFV